jgi:rubrerythrin
MPGKKGYGKPEPCQENKPKYMPEQCEECPDHPDLILLREAAADERNAIALYLEAATMACLGPCFLDVVEDEMNHYVETMHLIAWLDPVQAEMFREVGLTMLTMKRASEKMKSKWAMAAEQDDKESMPNMPSKKDLTAIQYLTKALDGELHAINTYQMYMEQAQCEEVKIHFCKLMNEEKEHVAEFTMCLFEITQEPLAGE